MATQAETLDKDAFMRLVTEERLQVEGPVQGYLYTGRQGKNGWELYRTLIGRKWVYQARRVCTQTDVGGGALTIRISIATGQVAELAHLVAIGSGSAGAALSVYKIDEDAAQNQNLSTIAAGVSRIAYLPSRGTDSGSTSNIVDTHRMLLLPGECIRVVTTAALQNETLTVGIGLSLMNSDTVPTWDTTGSAGTPSLAASSISTANTLQEVLC